MLGGGGCIVQLCAIPLHIRSEIHLNESPTYRPSLFTRFLFVSYSSSTLPVQTAPAPLLSPIHFALSHHRAKTVWQSQKHELFLLRFPPQLEQRPGWHLTHSMPGNGNYHVHLDEFEVLTIFAGDPLSYVSAEQAKSFDLICTCQV